MDDKERTRQAFIGLVTGFIAGCGLNYLFLLFQNWLSTWTTMKTVEITFWKVLPLGILMGLSMAAALRSGVLGD